MTRTRWFKGLGTLLLFLGSTLIGWAAMDVAHRWTVQRAGRAALAAGFDADPVPSVPNSVDVPSRPRPRHGELVGRIVIADLGLDAVAVEGIDLETLKGAVGHFPGTALPGEDGNASFAGHRDSFFRGLRDIEVGQSVEIEMWDAIQIYRVEEAWVVEPTQVDVVQPRGGRDLTLVTCFPFDYVGPAPQRFVVRARWVGERARQRLTEDPAGRAQPGARSG